MYDKVHRLDVYNQNSFGKFNSYRKKFTHTYGTGKLYFLIITDNIEINAPTNVLYNMYSRLYYEDYKNRYNIYQF